MQRKYMILVWGIAGILGVALATNAVVERRHQAERLVDYMAKSELKSTSIGALCDHETYSNDGKSYAKALMYCRQAAAEGVASGQRNMGIIFENGWGVPADNAQAEQWYRKAAEQGDSNALNNLGEMYHWDGAMAYVFYSLAAEKGNPAAAHNKKIEESRLSSSQLELAEKIKSAWKPGTPLPKSSKKS